MRNAEIGWAAACEGAEVERASLVEAIRDAIVSGAVPLRRESTLELWIEETAAHIVGDTMH